MNDTLENQYLIKEAKNIFTDTEKYSDDEIIGYYKLHMALANSQSNEIKLIENYTLISELKNDLQNLKKMQYQILYLYFFKDKTFTQIARILSTGHDIVFLTYKRCLRIILLNRKKDYEKKLLIEKKSKFINDIKTGIIPKYDLPISVLNLNVKLYSLLIRNNVTTLLTLVNLTDKEMKKMPGIGPKTKLKITEIQKNILSGNI